MPRYHLHPLALLIAATLTATFCFNRAALANPSSLLAYDFEAGPTWKNAQAYTTGSGSSARASWQSVGSYDVAGSARQSGGWLLSADSTLAKGAWKIGLVSGPLKLHSSETNLAKLTLSFTLSASMARPVRVKIASLDAKGRRTGGLETTIYPAAPGFLQRYALDLNTFAPNGAGKFDPGAAEIQLAFEIDSSSWPTGKNDLRLDNVNYASPAYYVSPQGSDSNDGRSERTAFATPQKAIDMAGPGDIVLLMEGTYEADLKPVVSFVRPGMPAAWIVLKNYPGQTPTLTSTGWNIVSIAEGSKEKKFEGPSLAYLEIRGLHVRGEADVVRKKYPDAVGKSDSRTNSNGIAIDGRYMKNMTHHIRIADNVVEYCPGAGIGTLESDWITIENNVCRNNCWTTIYATSGISTLGSTNFDAAPNIYKMLVRNNTCYRNETYEIWQAVGRVSDGNGIIIDINQKSDDNPNSSYIGRTLVQNNLSYDNGGSGIHTVRAYRVDIINNTTYLNSASKSLQYSQIFTYDSDDVRIINNILVAPIADVAAGEKPEPVNRLGGKNTNIIFSNNLYSGGNVSPTLGEDDKIIDPKFINASTDPLLANFHLKPDSPAIGAGKIEPFLPFLDKDGRVRGAQPDVGAYQH